MRGIKKGFSAIRMNLIFAYSSFFFKGERHNEAQIQQVADARREGNFVLGIRGRLPG